MTAKGESLVGSSIPWILTSSLLTTSYVPNHAILPGTSRIKVKTVPLYKLVIPNNVGRRNDEHK
jgi:hypothetical protein